MKKMGCFVQIIVLLLAVTAQAFAIRMESNGNSWFLSDGRIVQTKRVLKENGSEYPGLLCFDHTGKLLWEHTFSTPAIGRSCCQLLGDGTIAFLYYDENHQYYTEYISDQGNLIGKGTRELSTKDGLLFEYGAVYYEYFSQTENSVLSVRHWDERERHWVLHGVEKLSMLSAKTYSNRLYIEVQYRNSQNQSVHSLLSIDAVGENVWEYRLPSVLPVKAYAGNEMGGITLFVQKKAQNDLFDLEMITLGSQGEEISRVNVDGIPAVMAMNVMEDQKNGLYRLWGYGYENDGENRIICASLNGYGEVMERKDIPVEFGTCVRFVNDEVYVMVYENGIDSFELIPFDVFAQEKELS